MSDKPEPLAAVLAEMRLDADILVFPTLTPDKLRTYADRIEAAVERERNAHTNDIHNALYMATGIPGNSAAMREALERSTRRLRGIVRELPLEMQKYVNADIRDNDAALAAPARNCDVGTADGLHAAFVRHCDACNPPGGCCHRKDTRGMLNTNCASILKCFARFVLAKNEGGKE